MDLPPEPALRGIVQRYARLLSQFGAEFSCRPLILPTSEFFPDVFRRDQTSVRRLVERMQEHAGMSDIPISVRLVGVADAAESSQLGAGSCGSGGCATELTRQAPRLLDDGDGWRLHVTEAETGHSVALTTNLARLLASIFLEESRDATRTLDAPLEVTTDLAAVALGFGVLLLQGSYIYSKGCGGPSVTKLTALDPSELGVAVALFAQSSQGRSENAAQGRSAGHNLRHALSALEPTPREALAEAQRFVESNPALALALRDRPESLVDGTFALGETKSWVQRAFAKQRRASASSWNTLSEDASVEELEALLAAGRLATPARKPTQPTTKPASAGADDDLRALVEEALNAPQ